MIFGGIWGKIVAASMNRNVSILIVILTVVVIAGYLWWLRTQFSQTATLPTPTPVITQPYPTVLPTPSASPSAMPKLSPTISATKTATPSGIKL